MGRTSSDRNRSKMVMHNTDTTQIQLRKTIYLQIQAHKQNCRPIIQFRPYAWTTQLDKLKTCSNKLWMVRLWGQRIYWPAETINPPIKQMLDPFQWPKSILEVWFKTDAQGIEMLK